MKRMTPSEQDFADLFENVADVAELASGMQPDAVALENGIPIITGYDGEEATFPLPVRSVRGLKHLAIPLACALAELAPGLRPATLENYAADLRPFRNFLIEAKASGCRLGQIDDALLDRYQLWLDRAVTRLPKGRKKGARDAIFRQQGGRKLKPDTKLAIMEAVLRLLRVLRFHPTFGKQLSTSVDLTRVQHKPRGRGRRVPTPILTRPQLKMLVRICKEEVSEITARLDHVAAILAGEQIDEPVVSREIVLEVGRLDALFEGVPPRRAKLRKSEQVNGDKFPLLWRMNSADYNRALALIYPTPRLLLPFLLLFAIYYRYNPSVLRNLRDNDFDEQPSLRGTRLVGRPFKDRSGRTQIASWPVTDDAHNPKRMLATIARWTNRVRSIASDELGDRTFIAFSTPQKRVVGFDNWIITAALHEFFEAHEATIGKRFVLKALRPTVISLVHHLFDGDMAITMAAGQHRHARTTVDHYLSDGARQLNFEMLAPVLSARIAWIRTNGRQDPRSDARTRYDDGATPGFRCQDRFFNPVTRKPQIEVCTEYGLCPTCPMKEVDPFDPLAYALVWHLASAIQRSRGSMTAIAWQSRWSPILDELQINTLRSFDESAVDAADLDIPPLPLVE